MNFSDVVVQILDARNPLLFRCEDLEKYVNEVDPEKINVLLLNKSDFLTEEQRRIWANYFDDVGIKIAFFSAKDAALEELKESDEEKAADTISEVKTFYYHIYLFDIIINLSEHLEHNYTI